MFVDLKPDNILANYRHVEQGVIVEQVQIADHENAAYLPKPRCIKAMLAGNDNWRSPEGHFKGELNKATDMYSCGFVVSIYATLFLFIVNIPSASTLCSGVSYNALTATSNSTNRKVHYLPSSACSAKSHISGIKKV
jgi:serine/threonine protein kinase